MAENSKIEWTDHTFNPWIGCTKVGPGCDNCYAENMMDHRYHRVRWGAGNPRSRTSPANWRKPLAWNKGANGSRPRVFCASLADVFDNEVPLEWVVDTLDLIRATPSLDWLLLTKRVGRVRTVIDCATRYVNVNQAGKDMYGWLRRWQGREPPANIWLGATVVNQEEFDRDVPKLMQTPAAVRFLSCEPLLGPIDISAMCGGARPVDWIICGGESGRSARPMNEQWCLSLARQCADHGISFFMKQGSQANWPHWKEFDRWHDELRVRQLPTGESHSGG